MKKTPRKTNYLNNADLLFEINKSKMTWCYFPYADPDIKRRNNHLQPYATFDYAQPMSETGHEDLSLLDDEAKLTIILNEKRRKALKAGDETVYTLDDLVIRINTFDHIPRHPEYDPERKYRYINKTWTKVNFIPFKHYAKINGQWEAVVLSHHNDQGQFDTEHGKVTNELVRMFLKFVERLSRKFNFRNYTYTDEFVAQALLQLSSEGLKFDEAKAYVGKHRYLNPFAYIQRTIENSFIKIINEEKEQQSIRDDLLEYNHLSASFTRQLSNEERHFESESHRISQNYRIYSAEEVDSCRAAYNTTLHNPNMN